MQHHEILLTVATSILAEVSLGISQMKFSRPFSRYRGISCHVEMSWPGRGEASIQPSTIVASSERACSREPSGVHALDICHCYKAFQATRGDSQTLDIHRWLKGDRRVCATSDGVRSSQEDTQVSSTDLSPEGRCGSQKCRALPTQR